MDYSESEPYDIVPRGDSNCVVDDQGRDVITRRDEHSARHYADVLNRAYRHGYRRGYRDAGFPLTDGSPLSLRTESPLPAGLRSCLLYIMSCQGSRLRPSTSARMGGSHLYSGPHCADFPRYIQLGCETAPEETRALDCTVPRGVSRLSYPDPLDRSAR